ncbi:hypothetical protein RJ641_021163 [Dillenia turbinata]|uniref:At4g15545-like C-terminal domain-containing protein n=1 Tax=Dillenia turbinata TaxID=194707 RepID=A0AAN8UPU1_9MAGN
MLAKETGVSAFDLPQEILDVLPSDPFEQLDVARKITSIALSTRVSTLESDLSNLRANLAEKDHLVADLQSQVESLDSSLSETADKLALADRDKENLVKENSILANTVKKLSRDVSKLEVFRKTLMQSLQEDEESSAASASTPEVAAKIPIHSSLSAPSVTSEDDVTLPSSRSEERETGVSRPTISQSLLLASQTSTPRFTPPGSPPSLSASVSPTRTPRPVSPRRHSMSFSGTRSFLDDRSSLFSSVPSSHHSPLSGSESGSQTGRTRVDGKEFFRQVRSRLSYEQFGAFLANVKELNSHKQSREETLRKAEEIFGADNKDLYAIFEGLINRNIH